MQVVPAWTPCCVSHPAFVLMLFPFPELASSRRHWAGWVASVPMSAVSEHRLIRQAMLVTLACRDCCMCLNCVCTRSWPCLVCLTCESWLLVSLKRRRHPSGCFKRAAAADPALFLDSSRQLLCALPHAPVCCCPCKRGWPCPVCMFAAPRWCLCAAVPTHNTARALSTKQLRVWVEAIPAPRCKWPV